MIELPCAPPCVLFELELPTKEISLLLSVFLFVAVTIGGLVTRRMNGAASPVLRYGMSALWIATLLRLYSASSYIWGPTASEVGVISILRLAVIVLLTVELILVIGIVAYYARRASRVRKR